MSGKKGIIIQARMSSSRLPGKSLMKVGEHPLIWYVVQRAKVTGLPVVVATSTDPSDDPLCDYLRNEKMEFFRGDLMNVLDRYIKAAENFGIENIIRVTGDNPFVDVDYLEKSLPLFNRFSYVDGIYEKGLVKGTGFELVTLKELRNIPSKEQAHLEHVTLWLRENIKGSTKRKYLKPSDLNKFRPDISLTCDYIEDFDLISNILFHFNYLENIPLQQVFSFLSENPKLKSLNSHRHERD